MARKKKSIKTIYKEILFDEYDNEVAEKIEKLISIDNGDYETSKDYYETYLRIFYGIIKCENVKQLKELKEEIKENNPWENALEKKEQYRAIADSDRSILLSLLETEIQIIKEENLEALEKIYEKKVNRKDLANTFFENIFRDFEQAFDGNFENPRVIFMGINPKIVELNHDDYNLTDLYLNPFDSKRPVLMNNNLHLDFYS